jgi:hypothetical protein
MAAGRIVCRRGTALGGSGLMVFALMVLAREFFSSRIPIDLLIGRNTPHDMSAAPAALSTDGAAMDV